MTKEQTAAVADQLQQTAAVADQLQFDVAVIGAGVAGATAARELARLDARVCVLEAGNDVGCGATRANSGIVHAGFDPKPGSAKARYNVAGAKLFPQWAEELGFAYCVNGSLVCAFAEEEVASVKALVERGLENGVDVRYIDGAEVLALEPNINPEVKGALYAPTGAICDPMDVTFASLENAVANGVSLMFNKRVSCIAKPGENGLFAISCSDGSTVLARAIVNAAGVYADEINNLVSETKLKITPTRGDYCLFDPQVSDVVNATVFQTPSAAGKGVLVAHTIHGNLFVGPSSVPQESKDDLGTNAEGLAQILRDAKKTWPEASANGMITNFAGLRAKGNTGDFVIGPVEDAPGFFNIACFESPGLSSAPAVAEDIARWVRDFLGCGMNEAFNPHRDAPRYFAMMNEEQRKAAIAQDPAWGRIVCRCCQVTEAEIVGACHGPIPLLSLDSLKWRTGAMMGRCHGGFCSPEILQIVSRELGLKPEQIDKRLPGSLMAEKSREDYCELAASREESTHKPGMISISDSNGNTDVELQSSYDVVIVGAGAAGLAAAKKAVENGASSVLVIDRSLAFGGIMNQCIHSGFGLHRFKEELTGPEYADRQIKDLQGMPVTYLRDASVTAVAPGCVTAVSESGVHKIFAGAVVLATGSRERGVGAMNLEGERPSGVYTAGCAQSLMNLQGCLPGKKALIMGSGDIGLIMARRMHFGGMEVIGMCERGGKAAGLQRNVVQCLEDYGIPLMLHTTVVKLEGRTRLEAVWVVSTDENKQPIPGTQRRIECDTLVLSIGLIPENEIARQSGVELNARGGVVVDENCMTNLPGVFAAGNNVAICDLADSASAQGDIAGKAAAWWALGERQ